MGDDFEALKREATAWIVRITSGQATQGDAEDLSRWRARSAEHDRAFVEAARLWRSLGHAMAAPSRAAQTRFTRRGFLAAGSIAAGVAGIGLGMSQLGYLPSIGSLLADYSTDVGEQKSVRLPDGTLATLDGDTQVSLGFTDQTRALTLSSGAAVFDIADNDRRPFVVMAGLGQSRAGAGSFSVQQGSDEVIVDCLDGDLTVECLGKTNLRTGEGISYSAEGLGEKISSDADTAAAWRKGLLIFRDRPLADVVGDLNRHRKGKVVIARPSLRSRRVSGVFHLDRPEEILAHLEDTLQVQPISMVGGLVLLQ